METWPPPGKLRRGASYPAPRYQDPDDLRLLQVIKPRSNPGTRSVNIIGVPYDGAVLGRKGAAGGPKGIREAMAGFSTYNVDLRLGIEDARIFDLGDMVLDAKKRVSAVHAEIEEEVSRCLKTDAMLAILGGDNSISLPSIRACGRRLGKIGLIVVDSHLDLRGKMGGEPTSGSSYGLALEGIPELEPSRVVEIGAHGFLNSKRYYEKAERLGVGVYTAEDVRREGARSVATRAYLRASKGADAVYLSVDLDSVDLAEVSGVSAPSAGGIGARELLGLIFEIAKGERVRAADVVELAPSLDPTGRSPRVAADALLHLIAGYQAR